MLDCHESPPIGFNNQHLSCKPDPLQPKKKGTQGISPLSTVTKDIYKSWTLLDMIRNVALFPGLPTVQS